MKIMEFRAWIHVPGLPFEAEDRWEPFIRRLEGEHAHYGPTLGWENGGAQVVLSTDAESEAIAARDLYDAVAESLSTTGLVDLYPARVEIERTVGDEPATAAA